MREREVERGRGGGRNVELEYGKIENDRKKEDRMDSGI